MQVLEGKPQIMYPTQWEYRVIGKNKEAIEDVIAKVIKKEYELKEGHHSSHGKFVSVVVSVEVESEQERDHIFVTLRNDEAVNMVL